MENARIIKISTNLAVLVFFLWLAFFMFLASTGGLDGADEVIVIGVVVGTTAGTFILSLLGGHILKGHKGAFRLSVIIALSWIIFCLYELEPYDRRGDDWSLFIAIAIIPVLIFYGVTWVISGFVSDKATK